MDDSVDNCEERPVDAPEERSFEGEDVDGSDDGSMEGPEEG